MYTCFSIVDLNKIVSEGVELSPEHSIGLGAGGSFLNILLIKHILQHTGMTEGELWSFLGIEDRTGRFEAEWLQPGE